MPDRDDTRNLKRDKNEEKRGRSGSTRMKSVTEVENRSSGGSLGKQEELEDAKEIKETK